MNHTVKCAALIWLGLACSSSADVQADDADIAVPPLELIAGMTQAEWSLAWWQWAGSFSLEESPVADTTGELCGSRQSGPVWFLAGIKGASRAIRKCTIPSGTYVFFPLITSIVMPGRTGAVSCDMVRAQANRGTAGPASLLVDLNGTRVNHLTRYRQATATCFDLGAFADPPSRVYPSAANGYYVMLKPLEPGSYELNFGGTLQGMVQAVTYTLEVR